MVTGSAGFGARSGHAGLVFDNKMWVMAGQVDNANVLNDVWSSSDGKTWTQVTASAQWSARLMPAAVVFNNKMWIMGGQINNKTRYNSNDVWSSTDGKTWTQATASAAWSVRAYSQVVVFNNKMWLFGGDYNNGGTVCNDVWSSSDGATWTQVTSGAAWPKRATHAALVYNNKAWVIAGAGGAGASLSDVWSYDIPTNIQNNGKPVSPVALVTINTIRSNPSGTAVTIHYTLNRTEAVKIGIYTCAGSEIRTLTNEVQSTGIHSVVWNGSDAAGKAVCGGTYFVQFETGAGDITRKITLTK